MLETNFSKDKNVSLITLILQIYISYLETGLIGKLKNQRAFFNQYFENNSNNIKKHGMVLDLSSIQKIQP